MMERLCGEVMTQCFSVRWISCFYSEAMFGRAAWVPDSSQEQFLMSPQRWFCSGTSSELIAAAAAGWRPGGDRRYPIFIIGSLWNIWQLKSPIKIYQHQQPVCRRTADSNGSTFDNVGFSLWWFFICRSRVLFLSTYLLCEAAVFWQTTCSLWCPWMQHTVFNLSAETDGSAHPN